MIKSFKDLSSNDIELIKKLHSLQRSARNIAIRVGITNKTQVQEFLKIMGLRPLNGNNKRMQFLENGKGICRYCGEEKPIEMFQYNKFPNRPGYYNKYCNKCRYNNVKRQYNSNIYTYMKHKFGMIKKSAKKVGYEIDFDYNYLIEIYNKQGGLCFYTDKKMDVCGEGEGKQNCCSIDKIIPEKGYMKGNIVLCLNRVNTIKNNATILEMRLWMPRWYKRIKDLLNSNHD